MPKVVVPMCPQIALAKNAKVLAIGLKNARTKLLLKTQTGLGNPMTSKNDLALCAAALAIGLRIIK